MVRQRQSGFEALIKIAACFPWWLGIALALFLYIGLHHVANLEISKPQGLKGLGEFEGQTLYKTLALFGQYIIPLVLLAGAVISLTSSWRRWTTKAMMARDDTTTSTRVEPKLSGLDMEWGNRSFETDRGSPLVKPLAWSLELLRDIEWKRFEDLSAEYYREKGVRCETTSLGADGGIDLKLFQDDSGKPTTIVQCKAWGTQLVGVKPVRELRGVMASEAIDKGFFMTSGGFTKDAKEFAKTNRITLIDATLFLMMIKRLPQESQDRLLDFATKGDYTTPTCPSCGIKMVKRDSKRGVFWGCSRYPRCKQTLKIRRQSVA